MKRSTKPPLSLALQRAQVALHEATLEVGRIQDLQDRVRRALTDWTWDTEKKTVTFITTPELMSLLVFKLKGE